MAASLEQPGQPEREAEFDSKSDRLYWSDWGLTSDQTDTSAFEKILEQEAEQLRLDNDPTGRAGDVQRLVNNSMLVGCCLPLPIFGPCLTCFCCQPASSSICCQATPGWACSCVGPTTGPCVPHRYGTELASAQAHRLSLKQSTLYYERDESMALVNMMLSSGGKVGERLQRIPAKSMHIPLADAELEIHTMSSLPRPLHVWRGLVAWAGVRGHPEWITPQGQVLVIKRKGQPPGTPCVVCLDCGPNSNVQAFVDAVNKAKEAGVAMPAEAQIRYSKLSAPNGKKGGGIAFINQALSMLEAVVMPQQAPLAEVPAVTVEIPTATVMERESESVLLQSEREELESLRKSGYLPGAEFEGAELGLDKPRHGPSKSGPSSPKSATTNSGRPRANSNP